MKKMFRKITASLTAAACLAGLTAAFPQIMMPASAAEIVSNDFEVNYGGWHGTTTDTDLTAYENIGADGSRGMLVSGRTSPSEGASSSKGLYLSGGVEYDYSVKVFSESDQKFTLSLMYIDQETEQETTIILDEKNVTAGKWETLSASYKAPENTYEYELKITTDTTEDFRFDDVLITTEKVASAYAVPEGKGLKDEFADYFRVGNILNGGTVNNSAITARLIKDCNAIECENETKPDATLVKNGSSNTNIKVSLNSCAAIAEFCASHGIGFRGHTLVWHSQTPEWFFKENFDQYGQWVSKDVMNQRMESYIKNMFAAFDTQYPDLDLYSYDVCNECVSDDYNRTANAGGAREPGYGNGKSPWVQIYGNNSFVEQAFIYANKYAPEGCDLYYNDYNEYWDHKRDCIYTMCKSLYEKGLLDGVGMQSHIGAEWEGFTGVSTYVSAMKKYLSIGCDVQITELDISVDNGKYSYEDQAKKYEAIFKAAKEWNENPQSDGRVTLVQVWGPDDGHSWLKSGSNGLLYDASGKPKAAYDRVTSMIPDSEWGDGSHYSGSRAIKDIEPDENGYFFHSTFEGDMDNWSGRGDGTVMTSGRTAYEGKEALLVQNRTASWNGAIRPLGRAFKAGTAYSFSANVSYFDGGDADTFHLTLQYQGADGKTHYDKIASGDCAQGEWLQLKNESYTLPEGATDMQIYVETDKTENNFYIDDIYGAVEGTVIKGAGQPVIKVVRPGDLNFDGKVNVFDMVEAREFLANAPTDSKVLRAADADGNGKFEVNDLVLMNQYVVGVLADFPEPEIVEPPKSDYKYVENMQYKAAPGNYLDECSQKGTIINESYNGINGTNKLNVYLPYGYDANKQYNIFYLMHGGGENENTIFSKDVKLANILDHMIMNGELEPLIVVTPTFNKTEAGKFYDEFRKSVVPFVEGKYSTYAKSTSEADLKASRMHRAYGGFSMGALSTWCVADHDMDLVGYFMPLSGNNWEGMNSLTKEINSLGLAKNQYFFFCATGSEDLAYGNMKPEMEDLKNRSEFTYTSDFSKGNFYFLVAQGNVHWWGQVRNYVYDALPTFFHEGQ
ncbi:MAG: endo-1,4-beta-xylanase [Ruminococcus sp.]|nr:endo-1,4-beta-xylanase [Ruminococcus sp.]